MLESLKASLRMLMFVPLKPGGQADCSEATFNKYHQYTLQCLCPNFNQTAKELQSLNRHTMKPPAPALYILLWRAINTWHKQYRSYCLTRCCVWTLLQKARTKQTLTGLFMLQPFWTLNIVCGILIFPGDLALVLRICWPKSSQKRIKIKIQNGLFFRFLPQEQFLQWKWFKS